MAHGEIRPLGGGKRKLQWFERKPGHKYGTTLNEEKGGAAIGTPVLTRAEGQSPKLEGWLSSPAPSSVGVALPRQGTHCPCWWWVVGQNPQGQHLGLCVFGGGRDVFLYLGEVPGPWLHNVTVTVCLELRPPHVFPS